MVEFAGPEGRESTYTVLNRIEILKDSNSQRTQLNLLLFQVSDRQLKIMAGRQGLPEKIRTSVLFFLPVVAHIAKLAQVTSLRQQTF